MSETQTFNPFENEHAVQPESPANEIKYDRWGRYANLPAVPGVGVQPWTRVTTLAKTLEDTYFLDLWKQRQIVMGLAETPNLLDLVKGKRFDPTSKHGKDILNSIATQAMETAGSFSGADRGTEFHNVAEKIDSGGVVDVSDVDPAMAEMIRAYSNLLIRAKIRPIPELMERIVCVPSLGVAGRLDRIVDDNGTLRIGDLKSQKTLDFGHMSLAIQFACYANAEYILNFETWAWEPMPEVDKTMGLIAWVPAEEPGRAEVHEVDLTLGWTLARAAAKVREWRKVKGIVSRRAV